ncbi:hypothetical protein H4582DRAFT_1896491 [Lactarius indigo]|nr:hypothetical protein H4582DRAFT_1896491 [Lactarius indigo]
MYDDDDDCPFTAASHTNYGDDCPMNDLQANVYDRCFDDDDCPFTAASHTNYGDEFLMDDDDIDDCQLQDDLCSNWDDDDSPFVVGDSQPHVDDPLPSHESHPTRHTQPHPSTLSRRIESSDSQMPLSFEPPMRSDLSPDAIALLTVAELSHNPEFMKVYRRLNNLQSTLREVADELLEQPSISAELRVRTLNQVRERVLEWRMGVPVA